MTNFIRMLGDIDPYEKLIFEKNTDFILPYFFLQ